MVLSSPSTFPTDKGRGTTSRVYLRPKYNCAVDSDPVAKRVFAEYGSMLAAADSIRLPDRCIYESDEAVLQFQRGLKTRTAVIGEISVELQEPALLGLLAAPTDAAAAGRRITPLDGVIAGKRSFADTVRLWNSRFLPALNFWLRRGRITQDEANAARSATLNEQVKRVMDWESQGIYFSTDFSGSIFSSVAPPGTSQHLFLLAIDVVEYNDSAVVEALNRNGWFQTVVDDPPHFTYLGVPESHLPERGLRLVYQRGSAYWIPNLPPRDGK